MSEAPLPNRKKCYKDILRKILSPIAVYTIYKIVYPTGARRSEEFGGNEIIKLPAPEIVTLSTPDS